MERNLGEKRTARFNGNSICLFRSRSKELGDRSLPGTTRPGQPDSFSDSRRDRREDISNQGEIFTAPPHLCIEILSKDDTMEYMQEKIDDYLHFGVPYVWIINPRLRKGYVATKAGMVEAASGVLETSDPDIRVPVAELF